MITEVFTDMQVPWIQNYLLRSSLRRDAHDLCHAHNSSRSTNLYEEETIPEISNGFKAAFSSTHLSFPVISTADIVAGIGISSATVQNSGGVFYPEKQQIYRFLHNQASQYFLLFFEGLDTVDVTYQSYRSASGNYAKLKFNRRIFMHAFDESLKSGTINVSQINTSLLQSISCTRTFYTPRRAKILGNNVVPKNLHLIKRVFCSYSDSRPMMAFHSYSRSSWSPFNEEVALRRMRDYGITDRLQKLQIDRVSEMPDFNSVFSGLRPKISCTRRRNNDSDPKRNERTLINLQEGERDFSSYNVTKCAFPQNINISPSAVPSQTSTLFVSIAPGPGPQRPPSEEELKEQQRKAKKEQRKIKKRIAAAKYNDRKSAARKRRLEAEKSSGDANVDNVQRISSRGITLCKIAADLK